jgi:hypothetical protein
MDRRAWYGLALLGAAAAAAPSIAMWAFTVDDALIPIRYARHLAAGEGYRWNVGGPVTDGVTPLPWTFLLALLGPREPLDALALVKAFGIALWTITGALLGPALGASRWTIVALAVLALAFPLGAWAASGMETPIAMALTTFAAILFNERPRASAACAGAAAMFRPELVVWAGILSGGLARRSRLAIPLAIGPFFLVAVVRTIAFGRPAPLATLAKPSDATHGLAYAIGAGVIVLTPILAIAPLALRRSSRRAQMLALAAIGHALAIVAVGGDWMPYGRLWVPIAASLLFVFVETASHAAIARVVLAVSAGITFAVTLAGQGRHVLTDRRNLVLMARPHLRDAHIVAALDIGWLSAATDAAIVDLAGLTDPSIAVLSGGHTSKAVDLSMLLERDVDALLVYTPMRQVEARIVRADGFEKWFAKRANLPLGEHGVYTLYRRR